jgi:hypothetical protein
MDSAIATSLPDSPCMSKEHGSSSPDSDGEVIVSHRLPLYLMSLAICPCMSKLENRNV